MDNQHVSKTEKKKKKEKKIIEWIKKIFPMNQQLISQWYPEKWIS